MVKHIAALFFIYVCTSLAWFFLAGVTRERTYSQNSAISQEVGQLWGTEQTQIAPQFYYETERQERVQTAQGSEQKTIIERHAVPVESTQARADLNLQHRQKGLLWYSTYKVAFDGQYKFLNNTAEKRTIFADFQLPARDAIYDDLRVTLGGKPIAKTVPTNGVIRASVELEPGAEESYSAGYKSQGLSNWHYSFGDNIANVKNFDLKLTTNFDRPDFPAGSMSPSSKERTPNGWLLNWHYNNLLTGYNIGVTLPAKLNPGPWISEITCAAPVSLFLFFFVTFMLTTIKGIKVHPINYFFIGCGFFSFHLLLAYSADHLPIEIAFIVCSLVSIFLVVSYMRLVINNKFAFMDIGISQFIYLVLFSYTFFFEQYTGLAITVLSILTLFVTMQCTGRIDWSRALEKRTVLLEAPEAA
jgi:inner membrane protein involved in colicin E2 resistance